MSGNGKTMFVLHRRAARRKATKAARAEALAVLEDLAATAPDGGPASERPGVFWVEVPNERLDDAVARLPRLGYTDAVDVLEPDPGGEVRYRKRTYSLRRVYTEDAAAARDRAPDRRSFLLEGPDGVREVRGYRGSSGTGERRGLPVCDARLLVNLVAPAGPGVLLDPFAGAGGIVVEASSDGWTVASTDIDASLRHGLGRLAHHAVADARALPLATGSVHAVATEPPYDPGADAMLTPAFDEMRRVTRPGGRIAMLVHASHADTLRGASAGLETVLDEAVDRKGTPVVALAWTI